MAADLTISDTLRDSDSTWKPVQPINCSCVDSSESNKSECWLYIFVFISLTVMESFDQSEQSLLCKWHRLNIESFINFISVVFTISSLQWPLNPARENMKGPNWPIRCQSTSALVQHVIIRNTVHVGSARQQLGWDNVSLMSRLRKMLLTFQSVHYSLLVCTDH